jgi:hypothetical protein
MGMFVNVGFGMSVVLVFVLVMHKAFLLFMSMMPAQQGARNIWKANMFPNRQSLYHVWRFRRKPHRGIQNEEKNPPGGL